MPLIPLFLPVQFTQDSRLTTVSGDDTTFSVAVSNRTFTPAAPDNMTPGSNRVFTPADD